VHFIAPRPPAGIISGSRWRLAFSLLVDFSGESIRVADPAEFMGPAA